MFHVEQSDAEYAPAMRCVVNLAFDGYRRGEIVDLLPGAEAYIKRGWLSPVDEDGLRVVPLEQVRAAATWTPGDEDDPPAVPIPTGDDPDVMFDAAG